jgi:acetyltransferase-like isoleucine patch superfamily enzyme
VTFGANVVLRHPRKIRIGDNVVIDDNVVLDAKVRTTTASPSAMASLLAATPF